MPARAAEEFEKFVQNLIRPSSDSEAQLPATSTTNITIITGSVRCRIYVGGAGKVSTDPVAHHQDRPNQP